MGMFRITLQKVLILFRLVIVVSLTGYSLPTATAAMHGALSDVEISRSGDHHAAVSGDRHEVAGGNHAHGHHDHESHDDAQKLAKADCCKGFCVSMAIFANADTVGGPRVASIRAFVDDAQTRGELPPLHRPPNI